MGVDVAELSKVEELVMKRKWIIQELRRFEEKYRMSSVEFYEKWRKGEIPEPEDPEVHGDFMVWSGLVEELSKINSETLRKTRKM